jgi:hypothetical protein
MTLMASRSASRSRAEYFVVLQDNAWMIKHLGIHHGPYTTQRAAILTAINAAHGSGLDGFQAQVLVQGEDRLFRAEWTYGRDPYPPPG